MLTETRDGIEQVREIVVGAIQRDLERKIGKLETHLSARVSDLQQEVRRRIDVIEAHLRTEIDALEARLERELVELKEALRGLTRDHRDATSASDQRTVKLEESVARAQHDFRAQILQQAKSFLDELHQMRAEVAETVERELASFEPESAEEPMPRESREARESPAP
jgi:hypothetical protein